MNWIFLIGATLVIKGDSSNEYVISNYIFFIMFVIALLLLYDIGRRKTFENTRVCIVYRRSNEAFEI